MPDETHTNAPGDAASRAAEQMKEKAQDATAQAREQARDAAGQARSQLRSQVDERSTQVGERASSTAGDLRSVGEELRKKGNDTPARLADEAAQRVERLGDYLERTDGETLLHDVEDLARRNPWPVALGGLAVGFAASRMLRASSSDRHRARSTSNETSSPVGQLPPGRMTERVPSPTAPPADPGRGVPGAGVNTGTAGTAPSVPARPVPTEAGR